MSLIDQTYFFNEFSIAQKSHAPVASKLEEYIDTYEPEYLERAMGDDFANVFMDDNSDSRFDDLNTMLKKKPSPIAGYVFFHYQQDLSIMATGAGDARSKNENSDRSPETYRMVKAWNLMAKLTRKVRKYLCENEDLFPEYKEWEADCFLTNKINEHGL